MTFGSFRNGNFFRHLIKVFLNLFEISGLIVVIIHLHKIFRLVKVYILTTHTHMHVRTCVRTRTHILSVRWFIIITRFKY